MARKRTIIPALPGSSRALDWLLIVVGVVLLATGIIDGETGFVLFGSICIAVGALLLWAERFGRGGQDDGDRG